MLSAGSSETPPEPEAPPALKKLFSSTHFQHDIRTYNSILAFTSMGAQIDHSVMHKTGPFTYRIHGQNAHRIGSLVPEPGRPPKFSQLYIFDTANEIQNRITTVKRTAKVGELDPKIVKELIETMDTYNCLTKIFRKARDIHETDSCQDFSIRLVGQSKCNRQYDMPQTDEIAGLIVGDFTEDMGERDVVVQHRSSGLQHISDMHPLFMTLQYPILFPYGLLGSDKDWHDSMSEASQFSSPRSLRCLFVLILVFCQVSEPKKLWDHSWQDMAEDVLMHQRRLLRFQALQLTPSELQHYTLIEIESLLQKFEKSLNEFTGMPLPNKAIMDEMKKKAMARHN
ncbi:unnamed protein product, partial [Brassica napus]